MTLKGAVAWTPVPGILATTCEGRNLRLNDAEVEWAEQVRTALRAAASRRSAWPARPTPHFMVFEPNLDSCDLKPGRSDA